MCARNKEILERIAELADNGVFEIWYPGICDGGRNRECMDIYIPYMMNDALECYFILKNAILVGKQIEEQKQYTTVEIHKEENRYVLVAKQGKENVFTVFFQDVIKEKKYYRYDSICHFWEPGQEQWSQLVYIIGTMYDKYAFLGKEACNEEERNLLDLIEFAPFRYHAPARKLFEELYDNTKKGTQKMLELSRKAGDFWYCMAVKMYHLFPCKWLAGRLSRMLTKPSRYGLYCYIYERAVKGASGYPERVYPKETGFDINSMRKNLDERFKKNGFTGQYPDYVRGSLFVRTVEEHPFTIMDWEDFTLKQTLMVSECTGKHKGINMGFFHGKNLKGYYCSADELLE